MAAWALVLLLASGWGLDAASRRDVVLTAGAAVCMPRAASATADFLQEVPLATDDFITAPRGGPLDQAVDESPRQALARAVVARAKDRALDSKRASASPEVLRLGVRVARSDGTFSVRDDDGDDKPVFGNLDIGLRSDTPANTALFLDFALGQAPGYDGSLFDEIRGPLLVGGRVRGLETRDVFGEPVLLYRDREVLASRDDRKLLGLAARETTPVSHDRAGLVTRRRLAVPESTDLVDFGITLAPDPSLDRDWTVVGRILEDDGHLLDTIRSLPTYSANAVGDFSKEYPIAADVFKAERDIFRAAADAVGDTRLKSIFPGKILRRVEVTQVQVLRPTRV